MPAGIAITFPTSPIQGQEYLAQNGFTYVYDSQKNRWDRAGSFVRPPKVLTFAGVAATTTGAGIITGPNGSLIYNIPGTVNPSSDVGIDSYKAYRTTDSYPNYSEIQVSISSAFSSVAYAATSTSTTFSIPASTLSGNTTYYVRARQFVGSNASAASTGAISGYSQNIVKFTTASVFLDTPTIVSIAASTRFPVYQIGFAGTTLPATVTYTGGGVSNLDKVEWRVTGPRVPSSTGDTALAEVGIGTHSSTTLANALVLAMPFSGASGVGITSDVNNAIRTASSASAGTTKTITNAGAATTTSIAGLALTSHFYSSSAYFSGSTTSYLSGTSNSDFNFGTGDFTVEFWVYSQATGTNPSFFRRFFTTGPDSANSVQLGHIVTTTGVVVYYTDTSTITGKTIITNRWAHIALVRKGSLVSLYIDGILDGVATDSNNKSNQTPSIGCYNNTDDGRMQGYLQDLKIYKGVAKYQENFTPPLPTYGTISYTTGTPNVNVGVATTAFFESTGDIPTAEVAIGSSTAAQVASSLVLAMPMNRTFGFQDINVAIRGLTSGASAGTAKTVGLGTTSTANAPSHPRISATESKWYDGAAYFDGPINTQTSGADYLSIPNTTDFDMAGDFTWECWAYPVQLPSSDAWPTNWWQHSVLFGRGTPSVGDGWNLILGATKLIIQSSDSQIVSGTHNVAANNWYHFAATRSGSTVRIFVNGIVVGTATNSSSFGSGSNFYVGGETGEGAAFVGYLQDLKIYKGFAKYTANFTPPQPICGFSTDISTQTGFTTTTATGALLSSTVGLGTTSTLAFSADQTYAGVTSITSSSGITTLPDPYAQNLVLALPLANITGVGNSFTNDRNTQIRSVSIVGGGVTAGTTKTITNTNVSLATTSKWYNGSAYFSANGQLLSTPDNVDFQFGGTDFTIEMWIYPTLYSGYNTLIAKRQATTEWEIFLNTGNGALSWYNGSNLFISAAIPVLNTWSHIAATSRNGIITVYLNGVSVLTINYSTLSSTNTVYIGGIVGEPFYGYLQDLKVYKGVAKYTTNFTPPPPMFGDYTRSTPNKLIFTPASDYVLEARNTSGIITSSYSATRQWGTKPKGGIYDPYAANLVLAIPGGAQGGITTAFDVTGQIKLETITTTYSSGQTVTSPSGSTYTNKSLATNNGVTITSSGKYYNARLTFLQSEGDYLTYTASSDFNMGTGDFCFEAWIWPDNTQTTNPRIVGQTLNSSGNWDIYLEGSSGTSPISMMGGSYSLGVAFPSSSTWHHFAIIRRSGLVQAFINGIPSTTIISFSSNWGSSTDTFGISKIGSATNYNFNGYMNDIRLYKGTSKYQIGVPFTPPNQIYVA